jgi:hypothetical protein
MLSSLNLKSIIFYIFYYLLNVENYNFQVENRICFWNYYLAQAVLDLSIFLSLPPECWDFTYVYCVCLNIIYKPGIVVHSCMRSTQEAGQEDGEVKVSLDYLVRSCLKIYPKTLQTMLFTSHRFIYMLTLV